MSHRASMILTATTCLLSLMLGCGEPTDADPSASPFPGVTLTVTPSVGDVVILAGDSVVNTCPPGFCFLLYPEPAEPLFGYAPTPRRPLIALNADPADWPTVGTYPVSRGPTESTPMITLELDGPDAYWIALSGSVHITRSDGEYVTGTIDADAPGVAWPVTATNPDLHIEGSFVVPRP